MPKKCRVEPFYHHMNCFIEFSQEPCEIDKTLIAISDGELEV